MVVRSGQEIKDRVQPAVSIMLTGQTQNPLCQIQTKVCHDVRSFLCFSGCNESISKIDRSSIYYLK